MGDPENKKNQHNMKWWQLSLFGVGCTIGTGFFLGSSIGIQMTGPSVIISFIAAGLATYLVYDALSAMMAVHPEKGSFREYAKKAFGHWAGFSVGWVYCSSELLIMGSQLTALSIFSRFWFPQIPLWIFAVCYGALGIVVLLAGAKKLSDLENLFAVLKVAAIVMFIIIAIYFVFAEISRMGALHIPVSPQDFFPEGVSGLWTSLIFAFYAFGGIEVMGLMAAELRKPEEAPKAGRVMLGLLVIIYGMSISLALILVQWNQFSSEESPFVTVLEQFHLTFFSHLFNAVFIIAGFSTMVAALYGVTMILTTLAEDGDAPSMFARKERLSVSVPSLILLIVALGASIIMALLLPENIYEYVTTGAGLMLIYNWLFILQSSRRLTKPDTAGQVKIQMGMVLVLLAVSGAAVSESSRPGFLISLGFVAVIGMVSFFQSKIRSEKELR
ncbi:amino acid/polyamine/organocation transporter (APC superfamily) [Melghiribacillus thermohalophilus]|uniref:Amino acid/polyamine/organocation transporter (APC superfamily) n=1 Tax=Melghiribacillus thermohalophilus TaxID=1324956 RepID=A0A4V2V1F1_9BACI|nr:amino acid permease [Melghiribacillus thermohalophilus]TCT20942.1 amino acid/polyamine/organocation transporter (APC superfamily) [Melghiribacillus thermohalophilus]